MISAEHVSKRFGSHEVLRDISCSLAGGSLTAVLGGNGAGKSTLLRVFGGVLKPSAGVARIGVAPVTSVKTALGLGVRFIHQEGSLIPAWRVADHFAEPGAGWKDFAPWIRADHQIGSLNQHERQLLEVARATSGRPAAILADEPTAGLLTSERDLVMRSLRRACERGAAVVLVTHDLEMACAQADRIVVLRDGRIAIERPASEFTSKSLREAFGVSAPAVARRPAPAKTAPIISFRFRLGGPEVSAGPGEIVGLAATLKSGASNVLRQAVGLSAGKGTSVTLTLPAVDRQRRAVSYMSRERGTEWDFAGKSVVFNIAAGTWRTLARRGSIDGVAEQAAATRLAERFNVAAPSMSSPIDALSGGNRQKVVLARLAAGRPHVLLLDEPFSGIDITTRSALAHELRALADDGAAVVLFSHEWDDLCACTDRVAVIRDNGDVVVNASETVSSRRIAALMTGGASADTQEAVDGAR